MTKTCSSIRLIIILAATIALVPAITGCASSDSEGVRISRPWYSTEVEAEKVQSGDLAS